MLKVIGKLSARLEHLQEKITRIWSAMRKCTSRADIMGGGTICDRLAALTAKKFELEREFNDLLNIMIQCKYDLDLIIWQRIKSETLRRLMFERYGMLKDFPTIAQDLKMSRRQVYRLHKIALRIFYLKA